MSLLLLDTSILIDVLRGHEPAVELLGSLDTVPACSEITRVEILRDRRDEERQATEQLLETMDGRPRHRGRSQELEAELLTLNVRHFPMFEELEPPY